MASAAEIGPDDLVVEVGAGLGFLTRELASRAARVLAVEVDNALVSVLQRELRGWGELAEAITLCPMDALAKGRWNPELLSLIERDLGEGRWLLVANLPYSVGGPLLAGMVTLSQVPAGGAVMLQEEVALRLVAEPGSADYGALSVQLQSCYELSLLRRVGRDVFWPRPAVGSAVVGFALRSDSPMLARAPAERAAFSRFVRAVFGQRRKKLHNSIAGALRVGGRQPVELPAGAGDQRPGVLKWSSLVEIWDAADPLP